MARQAVYPPTFGFGYKDGTGTREFFHSRVRKIFPSNLLCLYRLDTSTDARGGKYRSIRKPHGFFEDSVSERVAPWVL